MRPLKLKKLEVKKLKYMLFIHQDRFTCCKKVGSKAMMSDREQVALLLLEDIFFSALFVSYIFL